MSKDQFCFCGTQGVSALGMCRKCYDANYRRAKTVERQLMNLGAIEPEQVRPTVTQFVRSLPVSRAHQQALGKALMPGVRKNSERYWGVGQ